MLPQGVLVVEALATVLEVTHEGFLSRVHADVDLQTALRSEALSAAGIHALERLLLRLPVPAKARVAVAADVLREVPALAEPLAAAFHGTCERPLARVDPSVLPEVGALGEDPSAARVRASVAECRARFSRASQKPPNPE
eukprot:scaffold7340_cov266-Pinguiococcus_pyrenoidosus.AAC.41